MKGRTTIHCTFAVVAFSATAVTGSYASQLNPQQHDRQILSGLEGGLNPCPQTVLGKLRPKKILPHTPGVQCPVIHRSERRQFLFPPDIDPERNLESPRRVKNLQIEKQVKPEDPENLGHHAK